MIKTIITLLFVMAISAQVGDIFHGDATWYNESWRKIPMASGLMYDNTRLEAAHRTLPFGTIVKVTRVTKSSKHVIVVITDRGPYAKNKKGKIKRNRVIDLTEAAGRKIDMISSGLVSVKVEILKMGTCTSWGSCKKRPFKRGLKVE